MVEAVIDVRENGPFKVSGPASVLDAQGVPFEIPAGKAFVLCRCGHSQNKPFCDATHRQIGFEAADTAPRAT